MYSHPLDQLAALLATTLHRKTGIQEGRTDKSNPLYLHGTPEVCWTWDGIRRKVQQIMDNAWSWQVESAIQIADL